jgi:hypothetical protein
MSYARWNESFDEDGRKRKSDVYVINGDTCFCHGTPQAVTPCDPISNEMPDSVISLIGHLMAHMEAGHAVPPRALDRLWIELLEFGVTVECLRCGKSLPPTATVYPVQTEFMRNAPANAPDRAYLCQRCFMEFVGEIPL